MLKLERDAFTQVYWLINGDNGTDSDIKSIAQDYYTEYEYDAWDNWYFRYNTGYMTDIAIVEPYDITISSAAKAVDMLCKDGILDAIGLVNDALRGKDAIYFTKNGDRCYIRLPTTEDYILFWGTM